MPQWMLLWVSAEHGLAGTCVLSGGGGKEGIRLRQGDVSLGNVVMKFTLHSSSSPVASIRMMVWVGGRVEMAPSLRPPLFCLLNSRTCSRTDWQPLRATDVFREVAKNRKWQPSTVPGLNLTLVNCKTQQNALEHSSHAFPSSWLYVLVKCTFSFLQVRIMFESLMVSVKINPKGRFLTGYRNLE